MRGGEYLESERILLPPHGQRHWICAFDLVPFDPTVQHIRLFFPSHAFGNLIE